MDVKPYVILAVALFVGLASASPYDELRSAFELRDTNLDEPAYRLKDNVQPVYQYVDLDVYLDESRFNGMTQIDIEVLEDNMTQIVLHQNVVSISAVTVLNSANAAVALQFPNGFELDSYYEILKINLANAINAGNYSLLITYTGQINENPFDRGLYKGYYFLNGEKRFYATTQFQPFHARKAFPCFDEPQFKNRFVISITRSTDLGPSYSNMAIASTQNVTANRIRETFLPTPIISAYLIAFHISDFVETTFASTAGRPIGIVSRPGVTDQHEFAASAGVAITNWMSNYFAFDYYSMGQDQPMKNDHIALPDFPSGAMENWGMVNYREAYLLYDEDHTNVLNQIFIATIVAHEMAHKWFGNLVTCFWWSNLWLNESFASFYEYFAAGPTHPEFELEDQFVIDYVQSALNSDAAAGATPMNWTGVVTTPSITSHFSTTSYAKGASVLKMMEHFVTPATFQKGQQYYLRDNAYGLGTPELMYSAFRTAVQEDQTLSQFTGIDVGAVFDSWVQNPGAPVVNVQVNSNTGVITLTQERFQLTGTPAETLWQIPLTYTRGNDIDFSSTRPTHVMTTRTMTIQKPAGEEWVVFNIRQSGLYRVNYDTNTWQLIARALRDDRESIHYLNRAQIVNDILYFMREGRVSITLGFDVLSFLSEETDYYVWSGALSQLDWFRRRTEHIPSLYNEFSDYMLTLLTKNTEELGFDQRADDRTSVILNRLINTNYACNLGHEGCVSDSLAKWQAFRNNPTTNLVPKNLRRHVYCIGLRNGDYSDYQFLWNQYETSQNTADMVVILRGLACTRNQTSIAHYLQESLYNDRIRAHDKTNAFSYALLGNPENLPTVLDFVYNNYAEIREYYGGTARLNTALSALAAYLTNFKDIVQFQSWLYQHQTDLPAEFDTGRAVISTAIANLERGNSFAIELNSYLRSWRSSGINLTASLTLTLAAVAIKFLNY